MSQIRNAADLLTTFFCSPCYNDRNRHKEKNRMKAVFTPLNVLILTLGTATSPTLAVNGLLSLDGDEDRVTVEHNETLAAISRVMTIGALKSI